MSTEENKATIKRLFEEMNKGNLDIIDEVFADDFLRHATDGQTMDRSAYKQIMTMLSGALPDLQSNLEGIVAEVVESGIQNAHEDTVSAIADVVQRSCVDQVVLCE